MKPTSPPSRRQFHLVPARRILEANPLVPNDGLFGSEPLRPDYCLFADKSSIQRIEKEFGLTTPARWDRPPAANSPTEAGLMLTYRSALNCVPPDSLVWAGTIGAGGALGSLNRGPEAGAGMGAFILFQRSVTSSRRTLSKPRLRATIR